MLTAHRLPRETPDEQEFRDRAIQQALMAAVEAPLEIARKAAMVFDKLGQLEPMAGTSMLSDVCVGRMMAATAVRGALANVSVNLESVTDATFDSHVRSEVLSLESRIDESSAATGR